MRSAARAVLIGLMGIAIWNPSAPLGRKPLDLAVVLDDSQSVDRQSADQAWRRIARAAASLPEASQLTVVRFGQSPVHEGTTSIAAARASGLLDSVHPPRSQALDRNGTDLAAALDEALLHLAPGRDSTIALLTDGRPTQGAARVALRMAQSAGAAVVALPLSGRREAGDAWIEALHAPAVARPGERVRIRVTVSGSQAAAGMLRLHAAGKLLAEQPIDLASRTPAEVELDWEIPQAEWIVLEAEVAVPGDPVAANDRLRAGIEVEVAPAIHYVKGNPEQASPLAESLRDAGWRVIAFDPAEYGRRLAYLGANEPGPGFAVLDDVGSSELPEPAWETLSRWVEAEGTGLLALGGPRSFGAGGYRGSRIERLLPVTARRRDPRAPAAILFLVDTSGSMERDATGRGRIALARQAIVATLEKIPDDDLVGISRFDTQVHTLLALGRHADASVDLAERLPAPRGGTQLRPALEHAIETLQAVSAEPRLVVLVTDGFVEGDDLGDLEKILAKAQITVVALAVGSDVALGPLAGLAAAGGARAGGRVLRVDETATLPRIMRREVGERLAPALPGPIQPQPQTPLPFGQAGSLLGTPMDALYSAWPVLAGLAATEARPGATVYLVSPDGHPIFAESEAGLGRTIALPGGLGVWAAAWPRWAGWPVLAGGLAQRLQRPSGNAELHLDVREAGEGISVKVDALHSDPTRTWSDAPSAEITVVDPLGRRHTTSVPAVAPGHFETVLAAPAIGRHRVLARIGERGVQRSLLRDARHERGATQPERSGLERWETEGLVEVWADEAVPAALEARRGTEPLQPWLTALALAGYLVVLGVLDRRRSATP